MYNGWLLKRIQHYTINTAASVGPKHLHLFFYYYSLVTYSDKIEECKGRNEWALSTTLHNTVFVLVKIRQIAPNTGHCTGSTREESVHPSVIVR